MSPAAAVEFQHYKDTIIEKINSFFGYKAIAELRLKQNFIPEKQPKKNVSLFKENRKTYNYQTSKSTRKVRRKNKIE